MREDDGVQVFFEAQDLIAKGGNIGLVGIHKYADNTDNGAVLSNGN